MSEKLKIIHGIEGSIQVQTATGIPVADSRAFAADLLAAMAHAYNHHVALCRALQELILESQEEGPEPYFKARGKATSALLAARAGSKEGV